jgi:hypothetical protein
LIVYTYFINPLLNCLKSGGIGHSANFNFKWNKINNYGQFLDKYSLQKSKMEYLSQLAEWIKPTTVTCNNDLETHLEAAYF